MTEDKRVDTALKARLGKELGLYMAVQHQINKMQEAGSKSAHPAAIPALLFLTTISPNRLKEFEAVVFDQASQGDDNSLAKECHATLQKLYAGVKVTDTEVLGLSFIIVSSLMQSAGLMGEVQS